MYTLKKGTDLDAGIEPDPMMIGQPMWQSRAIWVRNAAYDPNDPAKACENEEPQNPEYSGEGFLITLCVRVANRGQLKGAGLLKLYWAKAALGLGWDDQPGPVQGSTNGDWTAIDQTHALDLDAGVETVVGLPWQPPDPGGAEELHTCLLARIEAAAPDHIWTEKTNMGTNVGDVGYNAAQNNNIVWRNVHVVSGIITHGAGEERGSHPVVVRNLQAISSTLAIQLRVPEGSEGFFDEGRVVIDLPVALFDRWKAIGGPGRGFDVVPNSNSIVVERSEGALIRGLPMGPGQVETMQLRLEAKAGAMLAPLRSRALGVDQGEARSYDLELAQLLEQGTTLLEQGGVAYALRLPADPDGPTPSPTPTSTPSATPSPTGSVTISPSPSPTVTSVTPPAPPISWILLIPWTETRR
jgi:hypothetical protein